MNYKEEVLKLLMTIKGLRINICAELFKIIEKNKGQEAEILQYFYEISEKIHSSEEKDAEQIFTNGQTQDYAEKYGELTNAIIKKIIAKKLRKKDFYKEIWMNISDDVSYENREAKIFAVFYIWIDARIPYFELPESIEITKEEYTHFSEELGEKLQNARFILTCGLKKWTEVSYFLLGLLDEIEDSKEKTVFLSMVMQLRERMVIQAQTKREE